MQIEYHLAKEFRGQLIHATRAPTSAVRKRHRTDSEQKFKAEVERDRRAISPLSKEKAFNSNAKDLKDLSEQYRAADIVK